MARISRQIPAFALLCCVPLLLPCASIHGAEDDDNGVFDEREHVARSVDADGVVTFVSQFKILVERDGKRVPITVMGVNAPLILECKAWAEAAKVTDVVFEFVFGDKVVASAKGARRANTEFYEAKTNAPDIPGRMEFRVTVKAQRLAPGEKLPDAVKPPKPPPDEF